METPAPIEVRRYGSRSCPPVVLLHGGPAAQCCSAAYHQTWNDMLTRQQKGIYPAALETIRVPVVMLHGKDDPHPGAAIGKCLSKWIPHLDYHEFPRAGHYLWLERHARRRFEKVLRERLRSFFPQDDSSEDD